MRTPTRSSCVPALAGAALAALLVAAPRARSAATADAAAACVPAPIHDGAPPGWTAPAWADSSPHFRLPYSLASGDAAAAFFWTTLRAGDPSNPANKVLWVMRYPRNGTPLRITARFGADASTVVHASWPADSSPGEIYPSYLNLPKAGCWKLTLRWAAHSASIDVRIAPPRRSRG